MRRTRRNKMEEGYGSFLKTSEETGRSKNLRLVEGWIYIGRTRPSSRTGIDKLSYTDQIGS